MFPRLNVVAFMKFLAFPMQRLFQDSVYFKIIFPKSLKIQKRGLDGRAAKYGHFELRNIVMKENKFPRMSRLPSCTVLVFFFL